MSVKPESAAWFGTGHVTLQPPHHEKEESEAVITRDEEREVIGGCGHIRAASILTLQWPAPVGTRAELTAKAFVHPAGGGGGWVVARGGEGARGQEGGSEGARKVGGGR
ncbi:unnamed protein product [Pleuronectes platessa]|uniref:Uncharacterized protein n=1 Tax=Pleuronectes platessa TaxID=8262 RepID=A0A9N7VGB6_PLEPL|nr:unnamed protein product [Pleuronectes platessa]